MEKRQRNIFMDKKKNKNAKKNNAPKLLPLLTSSAEKLQEDIASRIEQGSDKIKLVNFDNIKSLQAICYNSDHVVRDRQLSNVMTLKDALAAGYELSDKTYYLLSVSSNRVGESSIIIEHLIVVTFAPS